jgi:ABC-type spermidine/putrescine transport system permease subunit I
MADSKVVPRHWLRRIQDPQVFLAVIASLLLGLGTLSVLCLPIIWRYRGGLPLELVWRLVANSFAIAIPSAVGAILVGIGIAVTSLQLPPGGPRRLVRYFLVGTVLLPTVLRTYGWLAVWQGMADWTGRDDFLGGARWKVVIGLINLYAPFVALLAGFWLERFPVAQIRAAATLGGGPFRILWRVMLPQAARPMIALLVLVTVLSAEAYITPTVLGSGRETMVVEELLRILNMELRPESSGVIGLMLIALVVGGAISITAISRRVTR